MRIEKGKWYRTRSGCVLGPMNVSAWDGGLAHILHASISGTFWSVDGGWVANRQGSPLDLVAEVPDPNAAPDDSPEALLDKANEAERVLHRLLIEGNSEVQVSNGVHWLDLKPGTHRIYRLKPKKVVPPLQILVRGTAGTWHYHNVAVNGGNVCVGCASLGPVQSVLGWLKPLRDDDQPMVTGHTNTIAQPRRNGVDYGAYRVKWEGIDELAAWLTEHYGDAKA